MGLLGFFKITFQSENNIVVCSACGYGPERVTKIFLCRRFSNELPEIQTLVEAKEHLTRNLTETSNNWYVRTFYPHFALKLFAFCHVNACMLVEIEGNGRGTEQGHGNRKRIPLDLEAKAQHYKNGVGSLPPQQQGN